MALTDVWESANDHAPNSCMGSPYQAKPARLLPATDRTKLFGGLGPEICSPIVMSDSRHGALATIISAFSSISVNNNRTTVEIRSKPTIFSCQHSHSSSYVLVTVDKSTYQLRISAVGDTKVPNKCKA